MLSFVQGDPEQPTGNLLVFSNVRGENPVTPGGNIILCNVVVSFVSAQANHFPVVIFPPTGLEEEVELQRILQLGPPYDLIQLEDFEVPAGGDENAYIKDRLEQFNQAVMEYVELCRDHVQNQYRRIEKREADGSFTPAPLGQTPSVLLAEPADEASALDQLEAAIQKRLAEAAQTEFDFGAPRRTDANPASPAAPQPGESRADFPESKSSPAPAPDSREIQAEQPAPSPRAEVEGASMGADSPGQGGASGARQARRELGKELKQILSFIEGHYPQYDVQNLGRALRQNGSDLARLYLQKFRAIQNEEYEQAASIQHRIESLEASGKIGR